MKRLACSGLLLLKLFLSFLDAHGRVLDLDDRFLDVENEGLWLVMFYAPWCGHCKNLEPTWIEVGAALADEKSDITVGRLDATQYSSVASHYSVRGFPTIKFFKQGQQIDYNGPRSKENIITFAHRASGPVVTSLHDGDSFLRAKEEHDVMFLYVGRDDEDMKTMYDEGAQSFFTVISFFSIEKSFLPEAVVVDVDPAILVFKDGKYFESSLSSTTSDSIKEWITSEQFPSYNHLTAFSYHTLKSAGKRFAIAVLNADTSFNITVHTLALSREYRYTFCWVEGNDIVNRMTVSKISVPNLIVYDTDTHEYYVMREGEVEQSFLEEDIEKFFQQVGDGSLPAKGGRDVMENTKRAFGEFTAFFLDLFENRPIVAAIVLTVPTILFFICCICLCSFNDGDDVGFTEEEESFEEEDSLITPEAAENEDNAKSMEAQDLPTPPSSSVVEETVTGEPILSQRSVATNGTADTESLPDEAGDAQLSEQEEAPPEGLRQRIK